MRWLVVGEIVVASRSRKSEDLVVILVFPVSFAELISFTIFFLAIVSSNSGCLMFFLKQISYYMMDHLDEVPVGLLSELFL